MKGARAIIAVLAVLTSLLLHGQDADEYKAGIEQWHRDRVEALKRENGWLNLAGLHWLKPGRNTFGSDASNDIVFPKESIAAYAGYIELTANNTVVLVPAAGAGISVNRREADRYLLFHPDSVRAPVAAAGSLRWSVIRRDDKIGIRLRDLNAASLAQFTGIERYKTDPKWRLEAELQSAGLPPQISITNVLGQTSLQKSAGKLVFSIDGKEYRLDALDEGDQLFVIFADATNLSETYPSGRFLYVNRPDASGKTVIDFNKAYNPPCAFTEYATCPLPPRENNLSLSVTAGEKRYGAH